MLSIAFSKGAEFKDHNDRLLAPQAWTANIQINATLLRKGKTANWPIRRVFSGLLRFFKTHDYKTGIHILGFILMTKFFSYKA